MVKVSIMGVSGFTAAELIKIFSRHKSVTLKHFISRTKGVRIKSLHPSLNIDAETENFSKKIIDDTDVVFLCLPHTESAKFAIPFIEKNKVVIDLSADFRLKNANIYRKTYGVPHPAPKLLSKAVYGLTEFYRNQIKTARIIANPGCYPTSVLLGLVPAIKGGFAKKEGIVIDSKSGVSGAGRKLASDWLFSNVYENLRAYSVAKHRHISEIEQELNLLTGEKVNFTFVPHLLPVERGILSTIYIPMKKFVNEDAVFLYYKKFYENERFIKVLERGTQPEIKNVNRTNFAHIGIVVDRNSLTLIVTVAIDNLVKGASGQAVQNMNVIFGFEEGEGLL
ncbi:MAG: N-acetyl-gamma-glutamyl-phosphate reductase [Elusimicrobia bacterium]|nr:N-acetyl-gamma-glutamyl-phosphate reductase [Elusimicrobiota bacterium]